MFTIDTDLLLKLKNKYLRKETKENRCIHTAFGCIDAGFNKAYIFEEIEPFVVSIVVFSIIGSIVGLKKALVLQAFWFRGYSLYANVFRIVLTFCPYVYIIIVRALIRGGDEHEPTDRASG